MMSKSDSVQRYWDHSASDFDALYESGTPFHRAFNAVFRKALFERIRLAADEVRKIGDATVLDVGCGSGRTAIPLARAGAKHVTGVDFAANMIALAERAASEAGVASRCTFRVADFMTDDFADGFDIVSAMGVLDYIPEPVPFVRRMLDFAKREVVFSVPKPSLVRANLRKLRYGRQGVTVHFHGEPAIRDFCRDAGAPTTRVMPIPAGYFVICDRG